VDTESIGRLAFTGIKTIMRLYG